MWVCLRNSPRKKSGIALFPPLTPPLMKWLSYFNLHTEFTLFFRKFSPPPNPSAVDRQIPPAVGLEVNRDAHRTASYQPPHDTPTTHVMVWKTHPEYIYFLFWQDADAHSLPLPMLWVCVYGHQPFPILNVAVNSLFDLPWSFSTLPYPKGSRTNLWRS